MSDELMCPKSANFDTSKAIFQNHPSEREALAREILIQLSGIQSCYEELDPKQISIEAYHRADAFLAYVKKEREK